MPKTISIVNNRSASGKTFVASQLALTLSKFGKRTLIIDLNPNGDLFKQYSRDTFSFNSWDIFNEPSKFKPQTICLNLDFIPSNLDLIEIEIKQFYQTNWEFCLQKFISSYLKEYDFIIIDNSPSIGKLVVNAIFAADLIIIPVTQEEMNYSVNSRLIYALSAAQINLKNLKIHFLINKIKSRDECEDLRELLITHYPYEILVGGIDDYNNVHDWIILKEFDNIAFSIISRHLN